jgi:hypothetical protein
MVNRAIVLLALVAAMTATATAQPTVATDRQTASAKHAPTVLGADEQVTLVIHTAENCPICKVWRESDTGLPVAKQLPERWPHLQVVLIERKSLYGSETDSLYPAQLGYLYEARKERYQLSPPVPLFEIVRDKQVIARQAGLPGWSEGILPDLERLEASRASTASSSPSTVAR